jgi:hypothetical protein
LGSAPFRYDFPSSTRRHIDIAFGKICARGKPANGGRPNRATAKARQGEIRIGLKREIAYSAFPVVVVAETGSKVVVVRVLQDQTSTVRGRARRACDHAAKAAVLEPIEWFTFIDWRNPKVLSDDH